MEFSVFIAQILATLYLSFGFGLIISSSYYQKKLPELLNSSSYRVLGGFTAIILGFIMVRHHNIWENNWTVVITIFGWLALLKGVLLLVFPSYVDVFRNWILLPKVSKYLAIIVLILGAVFAYFGFLL